MFTSFFLHKHLVYERFYFIMTHARHFGFQSRVQPLGLWPFSNSSLYFTKHHHHMFPHYPSPMRSLQYLPHFLPLISKTSPLNFLNPTMSNSCSLPTYYIPMKPSTKHMDWHPTRSSNHYWLHFSLYTNYKRNQPTLPLSPRASQQGEYLPRKLQKTMEKKSLPRHHVIKCAIRSIPPSLCQHGINIQTSLASTLTTSHHSHLPPLTLIVFWHGSQHI